MTNGTNQRTSQRDEQRDEQRQVIASQREQQMADAMQLESIRNQLGALLEGNPRKMEAFRARMLKMSTSYGLDKCSPESLIAVGMQALTLNLPLELGQGYVVAYKGIAQLDIGYKGWNVLAKRSGLSVLADAVYNCDYFKQSGFGFDTAIEFQPAHGERKPADDKWVKANLVGMIVSVREDATGLKQVRFVDRAMLDKIVGMSPSRDKDASPYKKWAEQMFAAKAIKQVLSKAPVDIARAAELVEAIGIVDKTEQAAQAVAAGPEPYSDERFETNWPKWVELVEAGKKPALTIITQLSNGYALTAEQMEKVMTLRDHEPIEGEAAEVAEADAGASA